MSVTKTINVDNVGRLFTIDGKDVWRLISYCEIPTLSFRNLETGEDKHFTIAQTDKLEEFKLLSVEGDKKDGNAFIHYAYVVSVLDDLKDRTCYLESGDKTLMYKEGEFYTIERGYQRELDLKEVVAFVRDNDWVKRQYAGQTGV